MKRLSLAYKVSNAFAAVQAFFFGKLAHGVCGHALLGEEEKKVTATATFFYLEVLLLFFSIVDELFDGHCHRWGIGCRRFQVDAQAGILDRFDGFVSESRDAGVVLFKFGKIFQQRFDA
jgi:hypothetical protein